jgi:hypothetical protein
VARPPTARGARGAEAGDVPGAAGEWYAREIASLNAECNRWVWVG